MPRHIRRTVAALAAATLLTTPCFAATSAEVNAGPAPPMVDVFVMRPLGLMALGMSALLFVPMAGITAATRPSELDLVVEAMLRKPARFVFEDPIGTH